MSGLPPGPGGSGDDRAVLCPACGSRNKATWEFCVRCGEEMAGTLAEAATPTLVEGRSAASPEPEVAPAAARTSESWGSLWPWAAVVVAAVILWRVIPSEPVPATGQHLLAALATAPPMHPPPKDPLSPAAELYAKGKRLLDTGNAAEAATLLAQAVELESGNAVFRHAYARALWMSGSRPAALAQYEEAARLAPETAAYRADLARAFLQEKRTADAVREFDHVLERTPDDFEILRELGLLLRQTGAQQRSTALLRRAAVLRPTDLGLMHEVGRSLEASGEWQDAADTYRQVLANFAGATIARGRLAEVLLKQGKADEALRTLEAGVERDPESVARLRLMQGSVLERSGRYAEAIARYRDYTRLASGASDAKAITARADELQQRLAEAEAAAKAEAASAQAALNSSRVRG